MSRLWWALLVGGALTHQVSGQQSPSSIVQTVQESLQEAGKKDEAASDKANCFCQRILAEKQQTVEKMQQQLTGLSHDIDEQQASMTRLDVEINMHQQELDSSSNALATAVALRKTDEEKFNEDQQSHTQSIDQLQGALAALKKHNSVDVALIALQTVKQRYANVRFGRHISLMQVQQHLQDSSSPEVVTGVVERMMHSFQKDLRDMRDDEAVNKERHEGLVSAKSQEIQSQKKHLLEKKQRLAGSKVKAGFNAQIKTRSEKVLDANIQLLSALKDVCQQSDSSFQKRKDALQAEFIALAEVQTALAGAQFLAISSRSRGDGAEKLCSVAVEIQDDSWRERAKAACKQAQSGSPQAAAESVEELETDIHQAQEEATRKQDECTQEIRGAQLESEVAAKQESAEANFVGSEQQAAEEQIEDLTSQSDGADKAKSDYADVVAAQKDAAQELRIAITRGEEALKTAASKARNQPATMKINEALDQAEKLMASMEDTNGAKSLQDLTSLMDSLRLVAGKALIPLRLMKAESEESAITIKEDAESRAHAGAPKCDANKLGAETARLKSYRFKLGRAAEALAWETLR